MAPSNKTGQNKTRQSITMLNIRLPDEIINWLDSLVEKGIYNSRSEAVRDFIRDFVLEHSGGKSEQ